MIYLHKTVGWIIIVGIVALMIALFVSANDKKEVAECLRWQKDLYEYKDFYLTEWQDAQCAFQGVPIDKPTTHYFQ